MGACVGGVYERGFERMLAGGSGKDIRGGRGGRRLVEKIR